MPVIVHLAEVATLGVLGVFCLALASDGLRGPVFEIASRDRAGRALIRSVQAAFVVGYGTFFAFSLATAFLQI